MLKEDNRLIVPVFLMEHYEQVASLMGCLHVARVNQKVRMEH
jgi:hypothetical protein